jgi:hypothetical protein
VRGEKARGRVRPIVPPQLPTDFRCEWDGQVGVELATTGSTSDAASCSLYTALSNSQRPRSRALLLGWRGRCKSRESSALHHAGRGRVVCRQGRHGGPWRQRERGRGIWTIDRRPSTVDHRLWGAAAACVLCTYRECMALKRLEAFPATAAPE